MEWVYLIGDFFRGIDSIIIDLLIIGIVDWSYLLRLVEKVEKVVNWKIWYLFYEVEEFFESMFECFMFEFFLFYFNKMEMN